MTSLRLIYMNCKMKTVFFSLFLMLGVAVSAQDETDQKARRERMESMRVGFLTKHLELGREEAQVFWPVYNEYQASMNGLRMERRKTFMEARNNMDEMSDAEVEKLVDREIAFRQKELDIRKKYHSEFKEVLAIKKLGKLYKLETEFKMEILKQAREKRKMHGGGEGDHQRAKMPGRF